MNFGITSSNIKSFIYDMNDQDIYGDYRPKKLLYERLEQDFYENIPNDIQGSANTNKMSGINPSRVNKNLGISTKDQEKKDFTIKKTNLKETICLARNAQEKAEKDNK